MKVVERLTIEPMKKRDVRAVMAIEERVYPKPWTASLFQSELLLTQTRQYLVAKSGRELVGYAGVMLVLEDAHVTTIAVAPSHVREGIATRMLVALARNAISRGAQAMTLEVRLSNKAAQGLYRRFGFSPVGVRAGYYEDPGGREDALIMWAHDVGTPEYADLLTSLENRCERDA